jgi:transposase
LSDHLELDHSVSALGEHSRSCGSQWAVTPIDWKHGLHLPLSWTGFHYSNLSDFRDQLIEHGAERLVFERVLERVRSLGFVKKHAKQRTDSTHIVACVERLGRLELA